MNKRIQTIANMVKKGEVVADIGTDHALLPIALIEQEIASKVYACDVNEGPLSQAKKNIEEKGLSNQIETILSDGLEHVPDDVTTFVITGMGYFTVVHILENALERLKESQEIILGVQSDLKEMRAWISEHHFTILDEVYMNEGNHDYIFMKICTKYHDAYTPVELLCGPILIDKMEEDYRNYCRKQVEKLNHIIRNTTSFADKQKKIAERNLWLFISMRQLMR